MFIGNLGLSKGFPYYPDLLIVCWCFSLFKCLSLYFGVLGVIGQRKLSVFFKGFHGPVCKTFGEGGPKINIKSQNLKFFVCVYIYNF